MNVLVKALSAGQGADECAGQGADECAGQGVDVSEVALRGGLRADPVLGWYSQPGGTSCPRTAAGGGGQDRLADRR